MAPIRLLPSVVAGCSFHSLMHAHTNSHEGARRAPNCSELAWRPCHRCQGLQTPLLPRALLLPAPFGLWVDEPGYGMDELQAVCRYPQAETECIVRASGWAGVLPCQTSRGDPVQLPLGRWSCYCWCLVSLTFRRGRHGPYCILVSFHSMRTGPCGNCYTRPGNSHGCPSHSLP